MIAKRSTEHRQPPARSHGLTLCRHRKYDSKNSECGKNSTIFLRTSQPTNWATEPTFLGNFGDVWVAQTFSPDVNRGLRHPPARLNPASSKLAATETCCYHIVLVTHLAPTLSKVSFSSLAGSATRDRPLSTVTVRSCERSPTCCSAPRLYYIAHPPAAQDRKCWPLLTTPQWELQVRHHDRAAHVALKQHRTTQDTLVKRPYWSVLKRLCT